MANFATTSDVRDGAGFNNNSNVTNTTIDGYIDQANGVLLSYVGARYDITKLTGSNFTDSQAEKFLKRMETTLAVGYLLIKEYGPDGVDTDKDGYQRLDEAKANLEQIMEGKIRLLFADGSEVPLGSRKENHNEGVKGSGLASSTGKRHFSIDQEF